jgi:hypothetical protein
MPDRLLYAWLPEGAGLGAAALPAMTSLAFGICLRATPQRVCQALADPFDAEYRSLRERSPQARQGANDELKGRCGVGGEVTLIDAEGGSAAVKTGRPLPKPDTSRLR